MDFSEVLAKTKILFDWEAQDEAPFLEISNLDSKTLFFKNSLSETNLKAPAVSISIKVRHYWYEHDFTQTSWLKDENDKISGINLHGPQEVLDEWRKNLEIGLCV